MTAGEMTLGRIVLAETATFSHQVNASSGEESVSLSGRQIGLLTSQALIKAQQADLMGMLDWDLSCTFTKKPAFNGFYRVKDVGTVFTEWIETGYFDWTLSLVRIGSSNSVDVESKLVSTPRENDFTLTPEYWHAPSIGAYAYMTGGASPAGTVTRDSMDGDIVVYRDVPANVAPIWGVAATNYMNGRSRVLAGGLERAGLRFDVGPTEWEIHNGLVQVKPPLDGSSTFTVGVWNGTAWEAKAWYLRAHGTDLTTFYAATVIRNDVERVTIRLVAGIAGVVGRTLVDLTLRRGSRFVEVYIQTTTATALGGKLVVGEATTDQTATGYVVATANDADGNQFIIGSPKTVTVDGSGVSKAAQVEMSLYIGAVVGGSGAVAGDLAADIRDQYIGTMGESTRVVKR